MSEIHNYRDEIRTILENCLHDFLSEFSVTEKGFPDLVLRNIDQVLGCDPAASPALLEACKYAKAQIKKGAPKKALPVLRAAIAKAAIDKDSTLDGKA